MLRSYMAAQRRSERDAARQYRALVADRARWEKLAHQARGQYEVQMHEAYLDFIVSLHRDATNPWDWHAVTVSPEPDVTDDHEEYAMAEVRAYKPSLMDRMLGRDKERLREIYAVVEQAKLRDVATNKERYDQWVWYKRLAEGVLRGDLEAYATVLEYLAPFDELEQSGASVRTVVREPWYVEAFVTVRNEAVVPRDEKKLLANGNVSSKEMSAGKYWAYYQDYVCSAALRVGRELFHLLPLRKAYVHVGAPMLNSATGHYEPTTILSVEFERNELLSLNFSRVDASDAAERFRPNMKFKKTTGFSPVQNIEPASSLTSE